MTFVGKVLVVVQVFLSLCFMAFAGAVFTVQQNWKAAHDKQVTELQTKDTQLREREEEISFLNKDLAASQAIEEDIQIYLDRLDEFAGLSGNDQIKTQLRQLAQRAQRAEQEVAALQDQVATRDTLLMESKQNYEKLETANKIVTDEAKERAQEVAQLRSINKDQNNLIARLTDEKFNLEERIFSMDTEVRTAADKQKSLLVQVASLREAALKSGIDIQQALAKEEPPPLVTGRILNTKPADRGGAELVEISLGSDDGLSVDHRLQVFSLSGKGRYLGEIKVVFVAEDRAVGEVILKSKNGVIQRGDNVTTKL